MSSIVFENVSKRFIIHHEKPRSFQDLLVKTLRRKNGNGSREEFWALHDVSFEVPQGQMIGLIGPNGAGKSTALKLIARIIEPTSGRIGVTGRVNALIELAAGFHEDLTGRENIYLSAALLGLGRSEIEGKFDEIVAFSELEKFIDVQVKHYSSGMHVRLGFAIATCIESEVLLVDEVLAVGDTSFQRKSFERIGEIRQKGTTIFYVSHSLPEVERLCDRALLLYNGQIAADGDPSEVAQKYQDLSAHAGHPRPGIFQAEYLECVMPTAIVAGQRAYARLTVRNRSSDLWRGQQGSAAEMISIGYRWLDAVGLVHLWPGPRTPLPRDVAPGESISVDALVLPPSIPGEYQLEFDLMAEGRGWFSQGGCLGPRAGVRVTTSGSAKER